MTRNTKRGKQSYRRPAQDCVVAHLPHGTHNTSGLASPRRSHLGCHEEGNQSSPSYTNTDQWYKSPAFIQGTIKVPHSPPSHISHHYNKNKFLPFFHEITGLITNLSQSLIICFHFETNKNNFYRFTVLQVSVSKA